MENQIIYHNRHTGKDEVEKVYGSELIEWLYNKKSGNLISHLLCKAPLSKLYGAYQNTNLSSLKIKKFVKDFHIPLEEYEWGEGGTEEEPYESFNDFFIRRFKPGARKFESESEILCAPAEGRYLGWEKMSDDVSYPVKGKDLSSSELLQNDKWSKIFEGGPLIISRLCPVDYHRFHFPDDGECEDYYSIPGEYHSVNPLALKFKSDIFSTNERQVSILKTKNFGFMAYMEVGAMMVGKIVQSHNLSESFNRGDEKGYFLFGGSTVIIMGEAGKWTPSEDMLLCTRKNKELYLRLGSKIGNLHC